MSSYLGVLTARLLGICLSQPVALVAGLLTRKASRHCEVAGGEAPSTGRNDLPSTKGGVVAPAISAKVGARSWLRTICWRVTPDATPGPLTIIGTAMSSS